MRSGSEASELSAAAGWASFGAALLLLICVLRPPAKNWLIDYYPNPTFEGEARTRAWIRRVNFEVPGDLLLSHVPDRAGFSVRFQSCLPLSDPTDLAVRLSADDRALLYVDGQLLVDSAPTDAIDQSSQERKKRRKDKGKKHIDMKPGNHLITLEYSNSGGSGALRLEMFQPGVRDGWLQNRLRRPSLDGRCDAS